MEFIEIGEILDGKQTGKSVSIRGWVHRERKQKAVSFFLVRDDSGIIQCAIKPDSKYWDEAQKLLVESSVEVTGKIKEDCRAPGGFELSVESLVTIHLAERFPITQEQSEEFLRDMRHLSIRSRRMTLIFKIRSAVFEAITLFYKERKFYQIQSPSFTGSACEGGSTVFEVKYGDKKAYLTQSWQLYGEAMIFSLQKIYTVAPSFRAERSRTRRHLAEYWHHEMEAAWITFEELLKFEEDLILFMIKYVVEKCEKELKELGRDVEELKKVKAPFKRISYEEAIKILGKKWGHDITDLEERSFVDPLKQPVFLTHFPREMKAFYMKVDPKDKRVVQGADLLVPTVGELIGGSMRISEPKELLESLKMFGLKEEDYGWYLDLRKYGSIPHGGFGMGIERIIMWIAGVEHIMDTIPFPRTMDRLAP